MQQDAKLEAVLDEMHEKIIREDDAKIPKESVMGVMGVMGVMSVMGVMGATNEQAPIPSPARIPAQSDLFGHVAPQEESVTYCPQQRQKERQKERQKQRQNQKEPEQLAYVGQARPSAVAKSPLETTDPDREMEIALQLAATLKGRGRYQKTYRAMSSVQKRQAGTAICEHLLASLQAQARAQNDMFGDSNRLSA
ncbi:MAG: hypothetical protein AAF541_18940 [Pseudomonadota bacterium]